MELVKALTPGAIVGLLFGIGVVTWVDPRTTAGTGLLLLVCIAVGTLIGAMFSAGKGKEG
jgi:hypothetical protein